jgi:hypothetical protein
MVHPPYIYSYSLKIHVVGAAKSVEKWIALPLSGVKDRCAFLLDSRQLQRMKS